MRLKQLQKEWRERNKEKIKQWNADFKSAQSDYVKEYNRIYQLDRYHSIPKIKLHNNVACMVRLALRGKKAGNVLETILGYTTEDLMRHIENQFDDKMTWDNYGEYWHIDHVKPQSLFNFESFEEDEFKECWGLNNLQPLSAKENRKKSNKYRSEI